MQIASTTEAELTILIVDSSEISGRGLAALLREQSSVWVVAIATNGSEAIRLWERYRPHVTLLDLRMQGMSGMDILRSIRQRDVNAIVVIFTTFGSEQDVLLAFRNGAKGYLLRDIGMKELLRGLHDVARGTPALSPSIAISLAQGASHIRLTSRELVVLRLVAQGQPNKMIADELGLTLATVKAHLTRIFEKLGVSSRTAAMAAAVQRGFI